MNAPRQIPMPRPVAGFIQSEFQEFLKTQSVMLAHYAHMAKDADRVEELQTALNNIGDALFQLHSLVVGAEFEGGGS